MNAPFRQGAVQSCFWESSYTNRRALEPRPPRLSRVTGEMAQRFLLAGAAGAHCIQKNEKGHTLPRFVLRVLQLLEKLEFRFRHLAIQRREASGINAHPCEHARCGIVFRIEAHRHAATRRYRARGRNHGRVRMRGSKGGLRCHSRMRRLKRHNVGM